MADTLEIIIKATDTTGNAFASLHGNLDKANQGGLSLAGTFKAVSVAAAAMVAVVGGTVIAGLTDSVKQTFDWNEQLHQLTKRFGMSGESASAYALAMNHVGLTVEEGGFGLNYFARMLDSAQKSEELNRKGLDAHGKKLKEVQRLTDPVSKAMRELGISMFDARGKAKSFDQLMPEIMNKFQKLPEGVESSAIAMDLFGGRAGSKFLEFLRMGTSGLKDMNSEFKNSGLIISTQQIQATEELGRQFNDLGLIVKGLFVTFGSALLPSLKEFVEFVKAKIAPLLQAWAKEWAPKVGEAMKMIIDAIKTGDWSKIAEGVMKIADKFWTWLTGKGGVLETTPDKMNSFVDAIGTWITTHDAEIKKVAVLLGTKLGELLAFVIRTDDKMLAFLPILIQRITDWINGPGRPLIQELVGAFVGALASSFQAGVANVDWGALLWAAIQTSWNVSLPGMTANAAKMLAEGLGQSIAGALGNFIPSFQFGGVMPGPIGKPGLAIVHGGEPVGFSAGAGAAPIVVHFTYAPAVSLATREEAQHILQPFIENGIRRARSRQIGATA